jgi:hypothetical protein
MEDQGRRIHLFEKCRAVLRLRVEEFSIEAEEHFKRNDWKWAVSGSREEFVPNRKQIMERADKLIVGLVLKDDETCANTSCGRIEIWISLHKRENGKMDAWGNIALVHEEFGGVTEED